MKKYFLQKIRKLIGTDKILELQHQINNELKNQNNKLNEIYYAQLFQSTIASSSWLKNKSFSPGRWAVDYSFLYTLYRVLNDLKPSKIVEFGLGQTTRMLGQYCDNFNVIAYTFEHDQNYIEFLQKSFEINKKIEVCRAELNETFYKGFKTFKYKCDIAKRTGDNVELIVLDGPFGTPRYSRIQILELVPECLNISNFCILIDDYQRLGEQDTVLEICSLFKKNNINFVKQNYKGSKEHILICSENNKFLTSL